MINQDIWDELYNKCESDREFVDCVVSLRKEYKLTWYDVAEIANAYTGEELTGDGYRKRYNHKEIPKCSVQSIRERIESDKLDEIKLERIKLSDERSQLNAQYRRISREESLRDIAIEAAKLIDENIKLNTPFANKFNKDYSNQVAILELSDVHYGVEIDNRWNSYNTEIAKQRLEQLRDEVIRIVTNNKIKKLYLVNLGDMIAGKIHLQLRINSRIDVMTQIMEISELLAEFINDLSKFMNVECYFTSDNHSRLEPNLKDNIELEQLSRITPWFLEQRLKNNKNIVIHTENNCDNDIVDFEILGHKVAAVHGHKDKISQVIKNLCMYNQQHYDLILTAHMHHFNSDESWATVQIGNGSLMGTDDYAEKLRLNSNPSQNLIIVSEKNACECIYKINLD